jgi:predicted metal-dependent enzyme (double-stranded beta helix superfamily)
MSVSVAASPGVGFLASAVREVIGRNAEAAVTADLVAQRLRVHLPSPAVLTAEQRLGSPDRYTQHLLHVEPDGSFSIVAVVWRPGQETPIHDHVSWCVVAVVEGTEYETLYALRQTGGLTWLMETVTTENPPGSVSAFAPPGDIHRVRNVGSDTAISIHIYGADISRLGSSIRRCYDLPVRRSR